MRGWDLHTTSGRSGPVLASFACGWVARDDDGRGGGERAGGGQRLLFPSGALTRESCRQVQCRCRLLDGAKRLLQLLLRAELRGVTALLLAAVGGAFVEAGVAPEQWGGRRGGCEGGERCVDFTRGTRPTKSKNKTTRLPNPRHRNPPPSPHQKKGIVTGDIRGSQIGKKCARARARAWGTVGVAQRVRL